MFFKKQDVDVKISVHKVDLEFTEKDLKLYDRLIDDVTFEVSNRIRKLPYETDNQFLERRQEEIMMSLTNKRYKFVDFPQLVYPEHYSEDYISPKMEWLLNNIPKFDGKTIIFDSRTMTTDLLCKILHDRNIKYYIIDGKIGQKDRNIILERFKDENDVNILICSDCLSYGVNLQSAKRIVNFNLLFNPSAIQQRQGRIIRKGQMNDVDIYFLQMNKTYEEKILDKLDYRSQIASDIFDDNFLKKRKRSISKNKMMQMILEKSSK